mmetsp:Transcript_20289/g.34992  ORF Transcript_20289/g.34992 Transcript_20289/m.34992 type:complete len:218 (-) Transcript_20289:124-777(-)
MATSWLTVLASQARKFLCTSWACSGVATFPVPIAHTGSYAITTFAQSALDSFAFKAAHCLSLTSMVLPASRSDNNSPQQNITFNPWSMAYLHLTATVSSVSLSCGKLRRSECPRITHSLPMSLIISALISPVNAPPFPVQQFWKATPQSDLSALRVNSPYKYGHPITTSTFFPATLSPLFKSVHKEVIIALLPLHFQLPPTMNFRIPFFFANQSMKY